jgi:RHS repeat-associated protein
MDIQSTASQTISSTIHRDAFGNQTSINGTWTGPFGYAGGFGYQQDADSGLMLLGHRYYDPSTGRFLTRDPIKDGRNWYSYGGGDGAPTNGVDPDGLLFWKVLIGAWLVYEAIQTANDIRQDPTDVGNWVGIVPIPAVKGTTKFVDTVKFISDGHQSLPLKGPAEGAGARFVNGVLHQLRFYDDKGDAKIDIDWGHDHGVGIPHYHIWYGTWRGHGNPF